MLVMKKKLLSGLATGVFLFGMAGVASATLTTIGNATYGGYDYNLIWDDDNNGNSVVWLDFSNPADTWVAQNLWAAGLNNELTYNIDSHFSVSWDGDWRLSSAIDGHVVDWNGFDGSTIAGYNITTSEMGHLYYSELNNLGFFNIDGSTNPYSSPDYFLLNTGDFQNLLTTWYWTNTLYAEGSYENAAWHFHMTEGRLSSPSPDFVGNGLAIRNVQVSETAPVPEPTTMLLFGTGIAGLAGTIIRKKKT